MLAMKSAIPSAAVAISGLTWSRPKSGPDWALAPKYVEDYLRSLDLEISPWAKGSKERFIIISPIAVEGRVLPPATSGCLQPT